MYNVAFLKSLSIQNQFSGMSLFGNSKLLSLDIYNEPFQTHSRLVMSRLAMSNQTEEFI